jgi:putrescine transport system substrate-binding protein
MAAIMYLGHDPNRFDPADLVAASALLQKIRPFVRYVDPAQPVPDLASLESKTGADVNFFIPREGGLIIVDMMAIPADAPHVRNASLWLDYLLRPDVISNITNFIKYPNGNAASLPFVAADIKNDVTVYPDARTRERLIPPHSKPMEYSRQMTREWTRFRTGY